MQRNKFSNLLIKLELFLKIHRAESIIENLLLILSSNIKFKKRNKILKEKENFCVTW